MKGGRRRSEGRDWWGSGSGRWRRRRRRSASTELQRRRNSGRIRVRVLERSCREGFLAFCVWDYGLGFRERASERSGRDDGGFISFGEWD